MKNMFLILGLFLSTVLFAQSNPEKFKKISNKYQDILKEYSKKYKKQQNEPFFIIKIDSLSKEYKKEQKELLKKIKLSEEKDYVIPSFDENPCKTKTNFQGFKEPKFDKYLTSYGSPKQYASSSFPKNQKELKAMVAFVVEKNGEISFVRADGFNENFNRDIEIEMYKNKSYLPRCVNGFPERTKFRLPVTLRID